MHFQATKHFLGNILNLTDFVSKNIFVVSNSVRSGFGLFSDFSAWLQTTVQTKISLYKKNSGKKCIFYHQHHSLFWEYNNKHAGGNFFVGKIEFSQSTKNFLISE